MKKKQLIDGLKSVLLNDVVISHKGEIIKIDGLRIKNNKIEIITNHDNRVIETENTYGK